MFRVQDTGIGIKEEDLSKLFKFFGKAYDNNEELNPSGIGLGLTICNKILNELGTCLEVESEFGVGTTFFFTLTLQVQSVQKEEPTLDSYSYLDQDI
jgi:signal transduction histidine kinase